MSNTINYYYLFEVSRGRTCYELVLRSITEIPAFEYKSECKYSEYDNVSRLTRIHPTIYPEGTSSGNVWKCGKRYILAHESDIVKARDQFVELTGQPLSVYTVRVIDHNDGELSQLTQDIDDMMAEEQELLDDITAKKKELYTLERKYDAARERTSQAHAKLQDWNRPLK